MNAVPAGCGWMSTAEAARRGYHWCNIYGCVNCYDPERPETAEGWDFTGPNAIGGYTRYYNGDHDLPMYHKGVCPSHVWAWDVRDGKYDTTTETA